MDRRVVLMLAATWFLVAAVDVYLNGFNIIDQFFEAFRAQVSLLP